MTVLVRLKQETSGLHAQIEQRVDAMQRLQSLAAYRDLLAAFWGFYAPVEQSLAQIDWLVLGIEWSERRKLPKLESDLVRLGVEPATLLRCSEIPRLTDSAAALGCLYVLEGATLGGQIIRRELESQMQITAANGGSFFDCYGESAGAMWTEFRNSVAIFAMTPTRENQIVQSAQETFQKFDDWLRISLKPVTPI